MTTAFVLSGGGSLGAVQAGMLQALTDNGVTPDLLIGTSAGALNAAYLAGHGTSREAVDALAGIWARLRRRDVFPISPARHALALAGVRESVFSSAGLRQVIASHLAYRHLEDAAIPVHVVATDLLTGREVLLSDGDAASAVLASAALPGLLPAVRRDGLTLVDGGLANNAAISQAAALGAERVFVLAAGVACALARPPASPYGHAMHSLTFLIQQQLIRDVIAYSDRIDLHVIPPLCPLAVSSADFGHARELIDRARVATADWLSSGRDRLPRQDRFLSLHGHQPGVAPAPAAPAPSSVASATRLQAKAQACGGAGTVAEDGCKHAEEGARAAPTWTAA